PPDNFGGTTYPFSTICPSVVQAWSSAVMDTARNRLIVWGGGHDYAGNEFYAVNLDDLTIERLTDPSVPTNDGGDCTVTTLADGKANGRSTYDGTVYMTSVDKMFVFGGSITCYPGGFTRDTWTFDLATLTWQRRSPTGINPRGVAGIVSAFDPNTGKVFLHDDLGLYAYDYATDHYQRLAFNNATDYHLTSVIDPVRMKFVMIGNGEAWAYDIGPGSTFTRQALPTTGGGAIVNSFSPGLAYDPAADRIVAWNDRDTVYSLNLDTNIWTPVTYPGGTGGGQANGTFKRWNYSPASGVFVLVNAMDQNAYVLRTGSIPPDVIPLPFSFTAQTGVVNSSVITSNTSTVTGITAPSPISIVGGEYAVNGGAYTAAAGTVINGDTVTLRQISSAGYSTMTTATLTIGGVSAAFNVTTQASGTLTVTKGGQGSGTVTSNPPGIDCGLDCTETYGIMTPVALTATPASGSMFMGWLGACIGTGPCNFNVDTATSVSATFAPDTVPPSIDIDGNGSYDALTDGLLLIRYLFGLTGNSLTSGAIGASANRTTPAAIEQFMDSIRPVLDVDGNGAADALTDGVLLIRYLFGLREGVLTNGAVGSGATRTTAAEIQNYIQSLMP
ncbi:MAG: hypothetical protein ABI831_27375, partial [Betaproteobacteria bacterium]